MTPTTEAGRALLDDLTLPHPPKARRGPNTGERARWAAMDNARAIVEASLPAIETEAAAAARAEVWATIGAGICGDDRLVEDMPCTLSPGHPGRHVGHHIPGWSARATLHDAGGGS